MLHFTYSRIVLRHSSEQGPWKDADAIMLLEYLCRTDQWPLAGDLRICVDHGTPGLIAERIKLTEDVEPLVASKFVRYRFEEAALTERR